MKIWDSVYICCALFDQQANLTDSIVGNTGKSGDKYATVLESMNSSLNFQKMLSH